jgi:hypothetical protein
MKVFNTLTFLMTVLLAVALTSCAQAPEEAMEVVSAAFENLETMNAKGYAPQAFEQAEQAYAAAVTEVELQKGKSFLTRSYADADEFLAKAKEAVEQAKERAENTREEIEQEAATLIEDTKQEVSTSETALGNLRLPDGKVEPIRDVFEEAGGALKEAEDAYKAGDFLSAQSKAEDAKALLDQVSENIFEARGGKRG